MPQRQRIVPDGCIEMIFHYGDLYRQYTNSAYIVQPWCFVIGQLTRPQEIEPTGTTGIFAVRFCMEGFVPFTTFHVKKMENRAGATELLFAVAGILLNKNILEAETTPDRIRIIEAVLRNYLANPTTIDRVANKPLK